MGMHRNESTKSASNSKKLAINFDRNTPKSNEEDEIYGKWYTDAMSSQEAYKKLVETFGVAIPISFSDATL
jgi:hypothetical protein